MGGRFEKTVILKKTYIGALVIFIDECGAKQEVIALKLYLIRLSKLERCLAI